jgi:hypothetical protein
MANKRYGIDYASKINDAKIDGQKGKILYRLVRIQI